MIGERFRKRDLLGICIAVVGAVTVVLSTQSSDTRLNPDALIRAICKTSFAVYTIVYLVLGLIFVSLSPGRIGQKYVFIDVGLCALFGRWLHLALKMLADNLPRGVYGAVNKGCLYLAHYGMGQHIHPLDHLRRNRGTPPDIVLLLPSLPLFVSLQSHNH